MPSPFLVKAVGSPGGSVDRDAVRAAAGLLFDARACHEFRALPSGKSRIVAPVDLSTGTVAEIAVALADGARGVYYTLNPVRPTLGDKAAKNADILKRRWILVDVDPVKAEPDASATEPEKGEAWSVAGEVLDALTAEGWPEPVIVDSGNGYHLLYRVDLPNDTASGLEVRDLLKILADRHDTDRAKVDRKVHNAARIAKLPGTFARKGKDTPERPHRPCRILHVPDPVKIVARSLLFRTTTQITLAAPEAKGDTPFTVEASDGDRQTAYAKSALLQELARVAMAPEGGRNNALNDAAFRVGTLVGAGELDRAEVSDQLAVAAVRAGLGEAEARRTIASGLGAGAAKPRVLPDLNGHHEGNGKAAASSSDWAEPILDVMPPAPPFPTEALPATLGDFVLDAARSLGCPVDYLGLACLGIASGAIGRSVAIAIKDGWVESACLYAAIVGDPGMTKTPALAVAAKPLWGITEDLIREYREAIAAAPDDDDPPPPRRLAVDDTTVEALAPILQDNPRGLVMLRDELTAWVSGLNQYKGGKGSDRQFFLSAWSGSPVVVDRKRNEGIPLHIPRPFLSVVGALTPAMLTELSETKNRDDGFLDRLLFVSPEPVKLRWTTEGLCPAATGEWDAAVRRLWSRGLIPGHDGRPRPFVARLTGPATNAFGLWFDKHCEEAESPNLPPHLRGPWAKFRAYCGRLSLICCLLRGAYERDWDGDCYLEIDEGSVADGIVLTEYFKSHTRRVRALLRGAGEDNEDARAMVKWFNHSGREVFSERDARLNFHGRFAGDHTALTDAVTWLTERRCVRPIPTPPKGEKGGRPPSPAYAINPELRGRHET